MNDWWAFKFVVEIDDEACHVCRKHGADEDECEVDSGSEEEDLGEVPEEMFEEIDLPEDQAEEDVKETGEQADEEDFVEETIVESIEPRDGEKHPQQPGAYE